MCIICDCCSENEQKQITVCHSTCGERYGRTSLLGRSFLTLASGVYLLDTSVSEIVGEVRGGSLAFSSCIVLFFHLVQKVSILCNLKNSKERKNFNCVCL